MTQQVIWVLLHFLGLLGGALFVEGRGHTPTCFGFVDARQHLLANVCFAARLAVSWAGVSALFCALFCVLCVLFCKAHRRVCFATAARHSLLCAAAA